MFQGVDVALVPDLDEVGYRGFEKIANELDLIASSVSFIRLPGEMGSSDGPREAFRGNEKETIKRLSNPISSDDDVDAPTLYKDPGAFPWDAVPTDDTNIIGQLIAHNLKTAYRQQPELAFAGALALMSVITGRKVEDPTGMRTNLYIIGTAGSGWGKEHARKLNKEILIKSSARHLIGNEAIGSHAGLAAAVAGSNATLMQVDELAHLLKSIKGAVSAPHLSHIPRVLLTMYSSANDLWIGDAYADEKKTREIFNPHLVLYGTCLSKSLWDSITKENISDGLVARLLVFEAPCKTEKQRVHKVAVPESLIERVSFWTSLTTPCVDESLPNANIIHYETGAEELLHDFDEENDRLPDDEFSALRMRTTEKARKIALVFACSRAWISTDFSTASLKIARDDVERAITIASWMTNRMIFQCQDRVTENAEDEKKQRIFRTVREHEKATGKGMPQTKLYDKTRWLSARDRREAIDDLITTKRLFRKSESTGGRPKTVYGTTR